MSEKNGKSLRGVIVFLIIFAIISGVISFGITYVRQKEQPEIIESSKENLTKKKAELKVYEIEDLLDGVEEIFLESYFGSNDVIELNKQESEYVRKTLQGLELRFGYVLNEAQLDYLYAVHLKNKKVKIKVNENQIYIENAQGISQVFEISQEQLGELKLELESVYMFHYNRHDIFQKGQKIVLSAMDVGFDWALSDEQIKNLKKNLNLISPIAGGTIMGVPAQYPSYSIKIKKDVKDFSIVLINEEILSIDSSDNISYYKYDDKLWKHLMKEYKVDNENNQESFRYLIHSSKVIIDAVNDSYDMEDTAFYNVEIPRYLTKVNKKVLDELMLDDYLMFKMKFTVNNTIKEVQIYENQIVYNGKIYYSEKIGEAIRSFLSV